MTVIDQFSLAGRTALVTGATRGLGRAFATALAEAGADIVVHGRDAELAEEVAGDIRGLGRTATVVLGDLTTAQGVSSVVDEATSKAGQIDVLVNNAGACIHRPALEVTDEEWTHVIDTNVTALWRMSQAVGAQMVERGSGTIVNVGSISAMIVNRPQFQPAYNASKAAVHQLTRSLAAEWAPKGVRVNALAPGYIKTDMSPVDEPQFRRMWIEDSAMQRYATPDELGGAMVFLASDASSFVTGSVLVVDGGYTVY
ncbi:SDR family NAD(P)-dependent oxidoreductase [Serinicoccus chungangensis]|uniref:SDR family NAD(P)-dependent oxidoreductase n=1 Tax=Serinicoccus chungangensis TaxID=767452 RepID=UPI0011194DF4|nr:glucose 1-dehydrogenase [Serinicoccus chungangensis]